MIATLEGQALAIRSWHRLACEGHALEPALAAAQGERTVLAAYHDVRRAAVDPLRARSVLGRAA